MKTIITLLVYLPLICFGQRGKNFVDSLEVIIDIKQNLIQIRDDFYLIQPETNLPASNITLYVGSSYALLVDDQWARLGPNIEYC